MSDNNDKLFQNEVVKIIDSYSYYEIRAGWFGRLYKIDGVGTEAFVWHSCRDGFQNVDKQSLQNPGVYFAHNDGGGANTAAFLRKIEGMLHIRMLSKVYKTSKKDVLLIKLASFWLKNKVNRSFLTLMLRCSLDYSKDSDNFIDAINANSYAKHCKQAIKRFLSGHIVYTGNRKFKSTIGWYEIFSDVKSIEETRRLLVRPKRKQRRNVTKRLDAAINRKSTKQKSTTRTAKAK